MFNLEILDKNKTYSGVIFKEDAGINSPSFWIQLSGWKVARGLGFKYKFSDIPTHSFCLVYEEFDWWVYESHSDTKGVHRIEAWLWISELKRKGSVSFQVFEDTLLIDKLKEKIGCGYGTVDIAAFFVDFFKGKPSLIHNFDGGLFCTEYISLCQDDSMIHGFSKLKNHYELQPVHHLIAMKELNRITFGRQYL